MAITRPLVSILMEEAKERPFCGEILQLGKQEIFCTEKELIGSARKNEFALKNVPNEPLVRAKFLKDKLCISDTFFFKSLGFSSVSSIDASDFESADFIHDLNNQEIPKELIGRFDYIINVGTIEHIFHLPNVLQNIFNMLKIGGCVIHAAPVSNHLEHGFYTFSPCFFIDYYNVNGFNVDKTLLLRSSSSKGKGFVDVCNGGYGSQAFKYLNRIGILDNRIYSLFFVATKTESSTGNSIPQQGHYEIAWDDSDEKDRAPVEKMSVIKDLFRAVMKLPVIGPCFETFVYKMMACLFVRWRRIR